MAARKSIVLVTVDCLRADHCGFMGYQRPTTPFLDGLATESFVFPTAIVAGDPPHSSFPAGLGSPSPLGFPRGGLWLARPHKNLAYACLQNGYTSPFFRVRPPYLS